MTRFFEKLRQGETPSAEDWNEHLREAHRLAPSMTPKAFAALSTADGKNSYEILAETLSPRLPSRAQIVDLACGDGYLTPFLLRRLGADGRVLGVDISEGELNVARQVCTDPRVSFELAPAEKLPLRDASVDQIVCHMAFMLMLPVEPVVAEIARVLKHGANAGNPGSRLPLHRRALSHGPQCAVRRSPIEHGLGPSGALFGQ